MSDWCAWMETKVDKLDAILNDPEVSDYEFLQLIRWVIQLREKKKREAKG